MLVDLRDRIQQQGRVPRMPRGWLAESAIRSAGGTPFAGDFIVTAMPEFTDRLEVAVVDVSGKGEAAGTRALLLSGAFGGLLGAVSPDDFLKAANDYLLRQEWDEGFATAVHLAIDLRTGSFEIRSAGHPPAAHRSAGTGRWTTYDGEGPALGLLDGVDFPPVTGLLRPGDVLMLYTDGLVETRTRDISSGIDRMLGEAEPVLHEALEGSADRLVSLVGSRADDRALVVLRRF
jgi:serine phosphatase RsbU (regulator of sigma subunit)